MRNVLFVSLRFPPHADGGVHRIAAFAKYLPRFGWNPVVLTGPMDQRRTLRDPTLLQRIPAEVDVLRTRHPSSKRLNWWLSRLRVLKLVRILTPSLPMMDATWIPFGYRGGVRLLSQHRFDAIYSSAYPMASHVVAGLLARRSGLPWVADYRDEWSTRSVVSWPTPVHQRLGRWIDQQVTAGAERVITTSPIHTEIFRRTFPVSEDSHYVTITNGFDEEDFAGARAQAETTRPRSSRFTLAHLGTLGGGRDGSGFLAAVQQLIDTGKIPEKEIEVLFVGRTVGLPHTRLEDAGILRRMPLQPHAEAVATMRNSDVLLLVNNERENILGKTFEYLAAGRPILALTPPGATADVVLETGAGAVFDPGDSTAIAEHLWEQFQTWREGRLESGGDPRRIQGYSREATARRLSALLDAVSTQ